MSSTPARTEALTEETTRFTQFPLTPTQSEWLRSTIRDIPDFPKPGIIFKDLTTLLKNPDAFRFVIDAMSEQCRELRHDYIAAIEARGFIIGPSIAHKLGAGFVPIRKPGKLPYTVERESYALEYGNDSIEIHMDAIEKGKRVVLVDDLLATGGTALAAYNLLTRLGAQVSRIPFIFPPGL